MIGQQILNKHDHATLRMRPASAQGRHFVQVVPTEFARIGSRCPLFFTKFAHTGKFFVGAVFGLVEGENLLADEDGGMEAAMPFELEREGFFIVGDDIVVDRDHARFSPSQVGDARNSTVALFDEDGEIDAPLRRVQQALASLHHGLAASDRFVAALLERKLIERIDVSLTFDDGERLVLEELYTVSRDALSELDDASVLTLFRDGHLHLAHTMIDSVAQVPFLAKRRNDRLG